MPIDVETKDCTALTDAELAEMGDICADGPARFDIGLLSKQREEWVLVTLARSDTKLHGFSFSTLERIGGTPSVLIGMASVKRAAKRADALKGMLTDQFRRAVLAFPDEDVLVGARFADPTAFAAFANGTILTDVVPRAGYRASGEDRAWGRRLAKRFGIDGGYDDRAFVATGDGTTPCIFDYEHTSPNGVDAEVGAVFEGLDLGRGDSIVAFGWAMAEDLDRLGR